MDQHMKTPYNKILTATEISSALYCCTKLRFVSERLYKLLLSQINDEFIDNASTTDMTTVYHSLSILKQKHTCPELNDFFNDKTELLYEKIKEFKYRYSANELSHILASMHLLIFREDVIRNNLEFIDYIVKAIIAREHINELPGNLICNIMLTMVKSGYENHEFKLDIAKKSVKRSRYMSQNELIKTLCSLTAFGKEFKTFAKKIIKCISNTHNRRRVLKAPSLNSVLECLFKLEIKDKSCVENLMKQFSYKMEIDKFGKEDLCDIILNLGKLKYDNWDHWRLMTVSVLKFNKDEHGFKNPKYVRNLILGWSHGQYHNAMAIDAVFKDLVEPGRLMKLSIEDLGKITWALGKLKYKNEDNYEIIGNHVISREGEFKEASHEALYDFIIGWAHVDFDEVYCVENFIWQVLKEENLKKFEKGQLLNLIYAFSHLGNLNAKYYVILIKELMRRWDEGNCMKLNTKDIRKVLLGCVKANYMNNDIVDVISRNLKEMSGSRDEEDLNCIKISFKMLAERNIKNQCNAQF